MTNSEQTVIGILYPGFAAEDDYVRFQQMVDNRVQVEVVHTSFDEDAHRVDALQEMGSSSRLLEGAQCIASKQVDAVLWTSTSASFVFGWEGVKNQVKTLENKLQIAASTTALAFVRAIRALGIRRVAIGATYPKDIADRFVNFLFAANIETLHVDCQGIITAGEVGTLQREAVLQLAIDSDHPDADALLIPDTALHSCAWLEELEASVSKPVLTANQVTFWEGLRLTGELQKQDGLGTLFRTAVMK